MGILLQQFPGDPGQTHEGHIQCDQCQALGPIYRETLDATIGTTAAYIATVAAGKARKQGWQIAGHYPGIRCQCPGCYVLDTNYIGALATADDQAFAATLAPPAEPEPTPILRRRRGIQLADDKPAPRCADTLDLPGIDYQIGIVYQIPVERLARDPEQPRVEFEPTALEALAADLVTSGQQSPIMFRIGQRDDGEAIVLQLYLVHGERRWRAAQLAGLPTIAGLLDPANPTAELPAERVLRQATDNDLHQPLSAWDWACTIKRLTEPPHNMRVGEISKELTRRGITGKSHSVVSTFLSLHRLPAWGQEAIQRGTLSRSHAKYILPHLDRVEIIDALGAWLAERVAKIMPAEAVEDDESAVDGSEPLPTSTINASTEAAYAARPVSIPDLRIAIEDLYAQLYMPLQGGKWLQSEPRAYVEARFDWAVECVRCPHYANVDQRFRTCGYCCDTTLECFHGKNLALARARDAQAKVYAGEGATADQNDRPIDVMRRLRRMELETEKVEREAILEALKRIEDLDTVLDLMLWLRKVQDYRVDEATREQISIRDIAKKRRKTPNETVKMLALEVAKTLNLYKDNIRKAVAEYLQIEREE